MKKKILLISPYFLSLQKQGLREHLQGPVHPVQPHPDPGLQHHLQRGRERFCGRAHRLRQDRLRRDRHNAPPVPERRGPRRLCDAQGLPGGHCLRRLAQQVLAARHEGRVGKNPGLKKNQPSVLFLVLFGFFLFFFCFFLGFFGFFKYICPEERVFRVFFSFKNTFRCIILTN